MYKPLRGRDGEIYYVFDADTAEEFLDFRIPSPIALTP